MRLPKLTTRSPIGLDVGGRQVKAAQLQKAHGQSAWRLTAVSLFPRPRPGQDLTTQEAHDIAEVLFRRGFGGNKVVVPVPNEKLLSAVLDVPARTAAVPIEQIARMELARAHRCPPDSFEMGCWDLPAPARAKRNPPVMAVACAHNEANAMLDVFESAGLQVTALDVRASALARAAAPIVPTDKAVCAILDLDWSSAMLVMLCDGAIVYTRALPDAGMRTLHEAVGRRCRLESEVIDFLLAGTDGNSTPPADGAMPAEARGLVTSHLESLIQELKVSLAYVSHEYSDTPLTKLLLTGSGAGTPGLAGALARDLGVEPRVLTAAEVVECPPEFLESASSAALMAAVGLAQFTGE